MGDLDEVFEKAEGQPIEGGCETCNAVQVLKASEPGVWVLTVMHDEWCPVLRWQKAGEK